MNSDESLSGVAAFVSPKHILTEERAPVGGFELTSKVTPKGEGSADIAAGLKINFVLLTA
jgi:hypothetical protein